MIKKQLYIIPETEVLEVRFEDALLQASVTTNSIRSLSYDDDELDC